MKLLPSFALLFLLGLISYGLPSVSQAPENNGPRTNDPGTREPETKTSKKPISPKKLSSHKPIQKAPTTKFFALSVGNAFTLPECQKRALPTPMYVPGEPHWCWKDPSGTPKSGEPAPSPVNQDVLVHFPPDDAPVYNISSGLTCRIDNGKLQRITFHTNGTRATDEVTEALTSLYGQPTRKEPVTVENNVGDPFPSVNSLWLYSNLAVDYRAVDGDLSLGTVWIETPAARKARLQSQKKTAGQKSP